MVGVGLRYTFRAVAGWGNIKHARLFENQLLIHFKEARRFIPALPKRFYKGVSISQISGKYEVNLDQKKLKTPLGRVFQVPNESLALAVANEWDTQKDKIQPDTMNIVSSFHYVHLGNSYQSFRSVNMIHYAVYYSLKCSFQVPNESLALAVANEWDTQKDKIQPDTMNITGLCYTALDNPTKKTKENSVSEILEFLGTDTLCYRVNEPERLKQLQKDKWDPVIDWFQQRYQVELKVSKSLLVPVIPQQTKETLQRHLFSFSDWALLGVSLAVENLKSIVLTLSLIDRFLDVETAVSLSRLEVEFQTDQWGKLEWAHELEQTQVQSKVAAAVIFVHLNSESTEYLKKCMKR
ncbi:ATP synthase mitochondrial F1 complex assembly factor 2-like [Tachypleus tridentatus]|uniref:ATP synthase mitochondrial F1 complex assembly factor 2-like n=1 Tax=Tachypleus tridentatus TaxID=6853 RepID=UPI003FD6A30F